MKLRLDELESRDVPALLAPTDYHPPGLLHGFTGPVSVAYGDVDGNGSGDSIYVAGPGGSMEVQVYSGGEIGVPLIPSPIPGGPASVPGQGDLLFDTIVGGVDYRGGGDVETIREPDGTTDLLVAPLPGGGGGPVLFTIDPRTGDVKGQLIFDENFRGGVRLFEGGPPTAQHGSAGPVAQPGDGNATWLATPGIGGAPVVAYGDAEGLIREFFVGPNEYRKVSADEYAPQPAGAGVNAPDGSGAFGVNIVRPDGSLQFFDYDGNEHADTLPPGSADADPFAFFEASHADH